MLTIYLPVRSPVQVLCESSADCVQHWHARCLTEDCIDDTPWLTDTERKLLDILTACSAYFVRSAASFSFLYFDLLRISVVMV